MNEDRLAMKYSVALAQENLEGILTMTILNLLLKLPQMIIKNSVCSLENAE
jgi:hypothetical protein